MASKKKLLAEGKQRLNEKLVSVEEKAAYMHTFIDDIVSKACSNARILIADTDKKSFLRHYSEANQDLERCLDRLYLLRASLPALSNDTDSDSDEEEDSVSDMCEGRSLFESSTPAVLKPSEGSLPDEGKTPHSDDVTSVSSDHGISCHGSISPEESKQSGNKMLESISEAQRCPSIKGHQHTNMQVAPEQVLEDPKQLVMSSSSFDGNTSKLSGGSTLHQSRVDSSQAANYLKSNNFIHGMRYQPDTISRLLQQSAMQPRIPNTTFADGTVLEVLVTEVVSPSIFWIQPVSSPLAGLMHQISLIYSEGRGQMLTIPVIGMACCSCFTQDNCWYRARIIDIIPSGSGSEVDVKIVYVDYGNCERLPLNRLRYLLPELAALQAQAVCAGLAEVKPPGEQTWTHEQTLFFVKLVVNQKLTATVSVRAGTQAPLVDLTYNLMANQAGPTVFSEGEMSPKIKINVASLMIENKHAARLIQNIPQTSVQQKSCESPTEVMPSVSHVTESSHPTTAPNDPLSSLSSISRAKQICERLKHDKKTGVHESNEGSKCAESNTDVGDQPLVYASKLSRSSSGVSSATNLSCPNTASELNQVSHQKDIGSDVRSTTSKRSVIRSKNPIKIPNIPRMDVRINGGTSRKEEVQSVRRGRGRGRGTLQRSPKSISDVSSEDSVISRLTSKRTETPRTPSFQKDAVIAKSVAAKERKVSSEAVDIPLPSSVSSSPPQGSPTKSIEVVSPVAEPTVLAERKVKVDAGGCINIAVSYIINPTEFYSHIISSDAFKLDYLMDELNDHFENSSSQDADTNFEVAVGSICSANFSTDKRWYRVAVLKTETRRPKTGSSELFAQIHYVDFGNKEWIPKCKLRKLPSWFFDLPPQVIRCSLAHVHPKKRQKEDEEKDALKEDRWSMEDIDKFVDLVGNLQRLTAKVLSKDVKENMETYNMIISSVIDGRQTCINERLVTLGHADSQVFSAQCDIPVVKIDYNDLTDGPTMGQQMTTTSNPSTQHTSPPSDTKQQTSEKTCLSPDSVKALEKWNPMTEDFVSQRNAYNIDVDDPGVATVGYKTENVHKICRFYAMGEMCYQGDSCKYLHSAEVRSETVDAYWNDNPILLPAEDSCVAMQITAYHGACHFWANLPYGAKPLEDVKVERGKHVVEDEGETLESLVESINNIYGKSSHTTHKTDLLLKADGELVCAKHTSDNKWYRARVLSTNAEGNTVEVFYLDFGDSEILPESCVRPMLPQFLHLPFQAVECFLYNLKSKEIDGKPHEARKVMEELTKDKTLVALVKSSMPSGTLHVVLIDTSGPGDKYINQELIDQGLAVSTPIDDSNKPMTNEKKLKKVGKYDDCMLSPG